MNITETILSVLFNIVITIVQILFYPIDLAINVFIPNLTLAFSAIANLITVMFSYIAYAISLTGITGLALTLIIAYTTFRLTLPINVWIAKLLFKWYKTVRP